MDRSTALSILETLADGQDPTTGEPLPDDGPYHQACVIRALYTATRHLKDSPPARTGRPKTKPEQAGRPWTAEEDQRLIRAFEARVPVFEIAAKHERTRGAILSRLVRIGKLAPRYDSAATEDPSESIETSQKWWQREGRTQAGKAWTPEEDKALLHDFDAGMAIDEIAVRLRRGVRAVEVRLVKLGKAAKPP